MDASANTASSGIGVIFCRIELAVPLVVDELIVACDCDHGAGPTFLAAISRAKKSSSRAKTCCENPTSFGFASGNGAAFATSRTIPATTATVLTAPLKRRINLADYCCNRGVPGLYA